MDPDEWQYISHRRPTAQCYLRGSEYVVINGRYLQTELRWISPVGTSINTPTYITCAAAEVRSPQIALSRSLWKALTLMILQSSS